MEIVSPNAGYSYEHDNYPTNCIGIIVKKNKKVGVISFNGKVLVPVAYDDYINGLRNCLFANKRAGGQNYYIYNTKGQLVKSGYLRNNDTLGAKRLALDYLR